MVDVAKHPRGEGVTELLVARAFLDFVEAGGYRWDGRRGEYINSASGRPVPESTIINEVERLESRYVDRLIQDTTQRLLDGAIPLPKWQQEMANIIKEANVIGLRIGRGPDVGFADYGAIGYRIGREYNFLDGFARDIKAGLMSAAEIAARARLYAGSARTAYWVGKDRAKEEAGYLYEQRFTSPGEICGDCSGYEALGKVPIGSTPPPGEGSVCMHHCRCRKVYYTE